MEVIERMRVDKEERGGGLCALPVSPVFSAASHVSPPLLL